MYWRRILGVLLTFVPLLSLAYVRKLQLAPTVADAAVAPRITFSISSDFKRDSLNRLYLNPGDTAVVSANTYDATGKRVQSTAIRWNALNPTALSFKGSDQGRSVVVIVHRPDSVTRITATWSGVSTNLVIRTEALRNITRDTTAARLTIEPDPVMVKANDSTVVKVRAWNANNVEIFGKQADFDLSGDTRDLVIKPFAGNTMARWIVAGPCPACTSDEQQHAFLRQTAMGMQWQVKTHTGWRNPTFASR